MAQFAATESKVDLARDVLFFPWKINLKPGCWRIDYEKPGKQGKKQPNPILDGWTDNLMDLSQGTVGGLNINTRRQVAGSSDPNLMRIKGDVIVLGHGNTSAKIAKEEDLNASSKTLACKDVAARIVEQFKNSGINESYAGKIIMWTCFGGWPG
jgi:hypothetical protein